MTTTTAYRLLRFLIVITGITAALFLVIILATYTYPFLIALFLAFLLNPIVDFLEKKWHISRAFAISIVICLLLISIFGFITLFFVELINGTSYLAEHIPEHFKNLIAFFESFIVEQIVPVYERLLYLLSILEPSQQTVIMNQIENVGQSIASFGAALLQDILQKISLALGNLPNYITVFVFSILGTFFISKDWYKLEKHFSQITPSWLTNSTKDVVNGLKKALFGYIKAQFTLISITAIIVLIGLLILDIDYAVTIAVIIGVIDLLPYIGTGLIFIPWILYMFFTNNYSLCIGISILYMIVVVQRQLMEPKVLSTNIGLHPLATLIALFAGYQLWGFSGLIIGPIVLVIFNTLYQIGILKQLWSYIKGQRD